jgi:FkbM family methyltransferase
MVTMKERDALWACLVVLLLFLRPSPRQQRNTSVSSPFTKTATEHAALSSSSSVERSGSGGHTVKFDGFNDELIPLNAVIDVNIGTNYSPFGPRDDRYRILVDPLFGVCDSNAKLTSNVTSFCFAVSNFTGFATFNEYNKKGGVSSSLARVQPGTSHGNFPLLSKRTVFVLEADILFTAIHRKHTQIHRLKLDLQGYELTVLRNIQTLMRETDLIVHVMAECFNPNKAGLQIYQVDNSCDEISTVLQTAGYVTDFKKNRNGGDVVAYKKRAAENFETEWQ